MSYKKQGFKSGDTLYATDLNEMDEQIYLNEQEITELKDALTEYLPNANGTHKGDLNLISAGGALGAVGPGYILRYNNDKTEMTYAQVFSSSDKPLSNRFRFYTYANNTETGYNVYGEHNKPTITYTGNGSATKRTIDVGGTGAWLGIRGGSHMAIVGEFGALLLSSETSSITRLNADACNFKNGVLTIATTNGVVNSNTIPFIGEVF